MSQYSETQLRRIRLHEPAVDFIDNHGSEYHPGARPVHRLIMIHFFKNYTGDPQATHRARNQKRYAKAPFKIRDKRSSGTRWKKEVSAARAQYMNLTGPLCEIRKCAAKPYVNFIPNGTYTSILSAGGKYTDRRMQTIQLYVAILVALEEVVRYYIEKPGLTSFATVKHAKSVFLGDEYERTTYLLRQADICHQKSSKRDPRSTASRWRQVQQTLEFQNSILLVLRDNPQNLEWLNDIDAERNRLKRKASARKLEIQRLTMQKAILEAKLHEVQLQSRHAVTSTTYISQLKLLELLATDPNIASADREACVHAGQAFKMATQDRAGWLMQSEKTEIMVRLIHGNHEPLKISPVSYLCAMLVESLEKLKPALVLYFFCGSHTQSRDPLSNAYALLKSLLAQLLSQHTFDTSFLQPYDLDSTVALFCIIDGISFFETSQREPAMHAVLDKLLALARGDTMGTVFKLLVTSPATTKPK
ncbi:hypothetical protein FN846DRAFT_943266, partial [Sphaerosporella brunnea]